MQRAQYAIAASPVRLSVRPSLGWISQKRWKVGLCDFHGKLALSIQYLWDNCHPEILFSLSQEVNQGRVEKTSYFPALCINISKKVKDTSKLLLKTNKTLSYGLSIGTKIDDIG